MENSEKVWKVIFWLEEDNVVRKFEKTRRKRNWLEEDIFIRKFQNIQENITWLEEDSFRLEKSNICGWVNFDWKQMNVLEKSKTSV